MKFTKFGRTGLTVSCLCLGTATFGKQTDESASRQILDNGGVDVLINNAGYGLYGSSLRGLGLKNRRINRPGLKTLERMWRSFSSAVQPRTRLRTAALLAP